MDALGTYYRLALWVAFINAVRMDTRLDGIRHAARMYLWGWKPLSESPGMLGARSTRYLDD